MKITSVADMKARLSSYLKATEEGPVVVTRNGKPVAVLVEAPEGEELERLILAYSPRFRALLDSARRRIGDNKGIPHEDFWEEVERGSKKKK